ncbi:hypothetical protein SSPIM334S_04774 [Streptomyces spiroverticillatus]
MLTIFRLTALRRRLARAPLDNAVCLALSRRTGRR